MSIYRSRSKLGLLASSRFWCVTLGACIGMAVSLGVAPGKDDALLAFMLGGMVIGLGVSVLLDAKRGRGGTRRSEQVPK